MSEKVFMDENAQRDLSFTLRDVAAIGFRHKRVMILCFCGIFLGVVLCGLLLPSKYQAETKLLVKRERADAVVTPGQAAPVMFRDTVTEEELNSEVELIHSEDVLRNVVITCRLDQKRSLLSLGGFKESQEHRTAKAVRKLKSELIADPIKKTNVIAVTYSNEDPRLAAKVLSTLDQLYIQKHVAVERPTGEYEFFEQETKQYKKALETAENHLKEFSTQQGVAPGLMRDLTVQKVNEFSSMLETTRSQILETEKRIQALEKQAGTTPTRMTTQLRKSDDAQVLQILKGTLTTLELKRTELLTKYQPTYPLVKEIDRELEDTRREARESLRKAKEEMRQSVEDAKHELRDAARQADRDLKKARDDMRERR